MKKDKILICANFYIEKRGNIGGATLLCSSFRDYLRTKSSSFDFAEFRISRYEILNYLYLALFPLFTCTYRKVVLVVSPFGFLYLFKYFSLVYKILGVKLILRVLGGDADQLFVKDRYQYLLRLCLKNAECVFFETKFLCNFFRPFCNVQWFPNSRDFHGSSFKDRIFSKKFVYIGRIREDKGIDLLLEAFDTKLHSFNLEIYGPIDNEYNSSSLFDKYYMGILPPNMVFDKLQAFDFLILPTKYAGEGYPGIIIESFAASTPVISTNWRAISELVTNNKNGLLMKYFHIDELVTTLLSITPDSYAPLRRGAFQDHKFFTNSVVIDTYFLKYVNI